MARMPGIEPGSPDPESSPLPLRHRGIKLFKMHIYKFIYQLLSKVIMNKETKKTCVCETRMPPAAAKLKYGRNLKVLNFDPAPPQGHVISVKCEEPKLVDELTNQVWLLYHHPNFKYFTLFVNGTEVRTDGRTDRRTIQLLDAPSGPFRPGHKKTSPLSTEGKHRFMHTRNYV